MRQSAWLLAVIALGCRVEPSFETAPEVDAGSVAAPAGDDDATAATSGGTSGTTGAGGAKSANAASGGSTPRGDATASGGNAAASSGANGTALPPSGDGDGGEPSLPDDAPPASDAGAPPAACDAQDVTFDEIRSGEVRSNTRVRLDAVATSQKFLVSHASSGGCLFGAFFGTEPAADGPRGVLVVSYGADAAAKQPCTPGHDAIPDELAPGDAVSAVGYVTSYAPSTCGAVTPAPQLMVDAGCSLARSGRRVLPAPFVLSPDAATRLATGTDAAFVRRFAGGLVQLQDLSTLRPDEGTGSVGPYGVVQFAETALELHNDLEYGDLGAGGPGDPDKSLVLPYPTTFSSITGLVYLDYCSWALTPRSRCADLVPPADDCP